jgi:phage terminase small subunit
MSRVPRAGYTGRPKNSSTLRLKNDIAGRINELINKRQSIDYAATQNAIERLALTKEALAREFVPLATSSMKNYVTVGLLDGQPYFDFSAVTEDQWRAVKTMTIEEFVDGKGGNAREVRRVKFQLHDKVPAGMAIAKLFGWIIERKEDISRIEER